MKDLTIQDFCDQFGACGDGVEYAEKKFGLDTMMSSVYPLIDEPDYLVWVATREGVFSETQNRQLAVDFARRVEHHHPVCKLTLDVVQRYIDGLATKDELDAAMAAAEDAAVAAWAAARASAGAAWAAARDAMDAAGDAAAGDAEMQAQAEIVRKLGNPFEVGGQ